MAAITPPPITRPEAHAAVIHFMLHEHNQVHASELLIINRRMYRVTVTEVAPEDMPAAARRVAEEITDE
jgi:coenzyme F420-reducing hydrogenase alpha subunit